MNTGEDMPTKPTATVIPLKPSLQPPPKRRADQRWGKAVIERGFTVVPTMLFWAQARLGLTADEFNVVLQLVAHWWDANEDPRGQTLIHLMAL
jgi:hypothetical protein